MAAFNAGLGGFSAPYLCRKCGALKHTEKETDVNLVLEMVTDAEAGRFTNALLLTGDTDQVPTVRRVVAKLGAGSVYVIVPPHRPIPRHLEQAAGGGAYVKLLRRKQVVRNLFPATTPDASGRGVPRPTIYDPP